jgi:adenosylcobinamide-phosphate guanylyltransferase
MCGGRGTRLEGEREKPLVSIGGVPMVDRVCDALRASRVERTFLVVSPHAPETRAYCRELVERVDTERGAVVETPGEGYVADLQRALADDRLATPVLTVAADLPLLDGEVVDRVLDAHEAGSLTVAVPAERKRELGVSVDTTFDHGGRELAPTGVNVVGDGPETTLVFDDDRVTVNVNRPGDLAAAERLLGGA